MAQVLFTFRLIPVIAFALARRSVDAAVLLRDAGLPEGALRGEVTAPLARIQDFVDRAAHSLGAPCFGLDLAASLPGGTYGVAEFLVRSAPTVEAGLAALCDFGALVNPSGRFALVRGQAGVGLHYALGAEKTTLGTHLNEFTIAYIARQMGMVTNSAGMIPLQRVWFSHTRRDADAVRARFGCAVEFGEDDCGLEVSRAIADLAPRTADALLYQFLHDQASSQLARLGPLDIVSQLVRVLEVRLASGELDAPSVAAAMAMSTRSLQRHLAEAGTSYRDVVAHVRSRRRAELEGRVSETEIAKALGFSDARAMRRSLGDA